MFRGSRFGEVVVVVCGLLMFDEVVDDAEVFARILVDFGW